MYWLNELVECCIVICCGSSSSLQISPFSCVIAMLVQYSYHCGPYSSVASLDKANPIQVRNTDKLPAFRCMCKTGNQNGKQRCDSILGDSVA